MVTSRHYTTYRNEEFIVLGHNAKFNNCMVVKLAGLPISEAEALRSIANSTLAQREHFYLMPLLSKAEHPSGVTWDQYLISLSTRRGGPVLTLPLKDIQENINPDQRAVWKGYGRPNPAPVSHVEPEHPVYEAPTPHVPETRLNPNSAPSLSRELDFKIDQLTETVMDESRMTRQSIDRLAAVLERAFPAPEATETKKSRKKEVGEKETV